MYLFYNIIDYIKIHMTKKYKVFKSFISNQDCDLLNEWVLENKIKFSEGRMKGMRLTSSSEDGN